MTKILYCSCAHKYQDDRYGTGKRVHNPVPPKPPSTKVTYRCAVCSKEKDA